MARTVVPARLAASRATSPSSRNASGAIPGRAYLLENEGFQEPSNQETKSVTSDVGTARVCLRANQTGGSPEAVPWTFLCAFDVSL